MNEMLISTKGRYALRMLLDIATHQGDGYVAMKDIAARQQISKKYLETFTAPLAAANILGIRRGKSGGYRLLRDPAEVTLLDVIWAAEGPLHAVACLECAPNRCPPGGVLHDAARVAGPGGRGDGLSEGRHPSAADGSGGPAAGVLRGRSLRRIVRDD